MCPYYQICSITDELWNPKCDRHTLEHPFFSLSKKKDMKPRNYRSPDNKIEISVTPSEYGLPTIWDRDLLIYVATLIRRAMYQGTMGSDNQPILIESWNFLQKTTRGDGQRQYKSLFDMLQRLYSCLIKTNIETNGTTYTQEFHLLDHYKVTSMSKSGNASVIEIKVCDWLYGAIYNAKQEMLSINRDYFSLGGIERRLYELARKHCGQQPYWKVAIETLWRKSGSQSPLKRFRYEVMRKQADLGTLPDYRVQLVPEKDQIIFYSRNFKAPVKSVIDAHGLSVDRPVY